MSIRIQRDVADAGRRVALAAGFDPLAVVDAGYGHIPAAIREEAQRRDVSVIVLGSPRRALGSLDAVVHQAQRPLFVGPPAGASSPPNAPIFMCYDGSREARQALSVAGDLLVGRSASVAAFMPAVDDLALLRSSLPWSVGPEVQEGQLAGLDRQEADAPAERAGEGARIAATADFAARPVPIPAMSASSEEEEEPWRRLLRAAATKRLPASSPGTDPPRRASAARPTDSSTTRIVRYSSSRERHEPDHRGSLVRIRQGDHTDRDLLVRGFERLGHESRYRRFLTPMRDLGEKTVRYMTEARPSRPRGDDRARRARPRGHRRRVRCVRDAERPDTAEVAVTVVDAWQGRGLGSLLLDVITARARDEGIRAFTALMLVRNDAMMHLFERLGPVTIVGRASGTVEIEVAIPCVAVAGELGELLRIAARHDARALSGRLP